MTSTLSTDSLARSRSREALVERVLELRSVMKRLFGAGLYRELRAEAHSVTLHQLSALGLLKHRSLTMRELAKELDVTESSATAVADRLVRQELAERQSDPTDRRIVRLVLSKRGRSLVNRIEVATAAKAAETLAALSDRQLEQLVGILETLGGTEQTATCASPPTGAGS